MLFEHRRHMFLTGLAPTAAQAVTARSLCRWPRGSLRCIRWMTVCVARLPSETFPDPAERRRGMGACAKPFAGPTTARAERSAESSESLDDGTAELLGTPLFAPTLLLKGLAFAEEG